MKSTLTLLTLASMALPLSVQAATVGLPAIPATATSPDADGAPGSLLAIDAGLLDAYINTSASGTAITGAWAGTATGGASIELLGGIVAGLDLQTQTVLGTSAIEFNSITTTSGAVGDILETLNVDTLLTAGLFQTWTATVNLSALGMTFNPNTTYTLTFDLTQSTSLLGNISPAVFNAFDVSVGDSSGVLPAGLLGITDLVGASGTVNFDFTTGDVIDGDVTATFGATTLVDTAVDLDLVENLLGATGTNTLYSISGINVIPEPGAAALGVVGASLLVLRRRRFM